MKKIIIGTTFVILIYLPLIAVASKKQSDVDMHNSGNNPNEPFIDELINSKIDNLLIFQKNKINEMVDNRIDSKLQSVDDKIDKLNIAFGASSTIIGYSAYILAAISFFLIIISSGLALWNSYFLKKYYKMAIKTIDEFQIHISEKTNKILNDNLKSAEILSYRYDLNSNHEEEIGIAIRGLGELGDARIISSLHDLIKKDTTSSANKELAIKAINKIQNRCQKQKEFTYDCAIKNLSKREKPITKRIKDKIYS